VTAGRATPEDQLHAGQPEPVWFAERARQRGAVNLTTRTATGINLPEY
jgi:hypothetical protein